jgi:ATP-dependent DNA helicase RecG
MDDEIKLLEELMASEEDEHLEFKEAKTSYEFENLVKYCVALANERGGKFILGITDKRPRRVVGSQAFANLDRTKAGLMQRLPFRVDIVEVNHPDGRALIVDIPPRPIGTPIEYKGTYWMRAGQSLVHMTQDRLKKIFDEAVPDYSTYTCPNASMDDLNPEAIEDFRKRWIRKSGNQSLAQLPHEKLLEDAELIVDGQLTYAALILFGRKEALGKFLPQSEVIFEYRSTETPGPAQDRVEYRQGFFSFYDELWNKINQRNDTQHYQEGLFMVDVPTFNEGAIREALLNAVSHREYRDSRSVFIRQYQRRIEIVSPGGFPPGITPDNILDRQHPRNRRLAEAFQKCGLVERAGQGADRIFESCLLDGKSLPGFQGTDEYQVSITLDGQVQDPRFLQFLGRVGQERMASFTTYDLMALNRVFRGEKLPEVLAKRVPSLINKGLLERAGRKKLILSKEFHAFLNEKGTYTRKKGLDRGYNKVLLLKHIQGNESEGCKFKEFFQVLPSHTRNQIKSMIHELKEEGKIRVEGTTNAARWFPNTE